MCDDRQMVVELGTGTLRPAVQTDPILSSSGGPWSGFSLEEHDSEGPREGSNLAPAEHVIMVKLDLAGAIELKQEDQWMEMDMQPGQFLMFPAMVPFSYRCRDLGRFLTVSLDRSFVRCAAHDLLSGPDGWEWGESVPVTDPLVFSLGVSLHEEALAGFAGGRTYGESLAAALAVQLVRRYGASCPVPGGSANGSRLNRHQLRRTLDFIHDHLAGEVSLAALAGRAGLSPFHFARLFKATTGQAPHQYVLRCRVERARQLLLGSTQTAADVAVRVGFCDQSHLTSHFKRHYGVTPREFRQRMGADKVFA